ncbi:MAG: hypothetical protein AAF633_04860, partial [Chloroflexota bacterium]
RQWHILADVNQDGADVVALKQMLQQTPEILEKEIERDIEDNSSALIAYVASADGLQATNAATTVAHHFANVMFNVMRGGIYARGYALEKADLLDFMTIRNKAVLARQAEWLNQLPDRLDIRQLYQLAAQLEPGSLIELWHQPLFAYANVPYRIRPYAEMLADRYDTIDFDWSAEREIEGRVVRLGTDGKLVLDASDSVLHVTMVEKLLVLLLAKLTNLVPEGGINGCWFKM